MCSQKLNRDWHLTSCNQPVHLY